MTIGSVLPGEPLPRGWRACVHCGSVYVPTGLRQKWCAAAACRLHHARTRQAAYRKRRREIERAAQESGNE